MVSRSKSGEQLKGTEESTTDPVRDLTAYIENLVAAISVYLAGERLRLEKNIRLLIVKCIAGVGVLLLLISSMLAGTFMVFAGLAKLLEKQIGQIGAQIAIGLLPMIGAALVIAYLWWQTKRTIEQKLISLQKRNQETAKG